MVGTENGVQANDSQLIVNGISPCPMHAIVCSYSNFDHDKTQMFYMYLLPVVRCACVCLRGILCTTVAIMTRKMFSQASMELIENCVSVFLVFIHRL